MTALTGSQGSAGLAIQCQLCMAVSTQLVKLFLDQRRQLRALLVAINANPGPTVIHKVMVASGAINAVMIRMPKGHW